MLKLLANCQFDSYMTTVFIEHSFEVPIEHSKDFMDQVDVLMVNEQLQICISE